jgi:hypothetical protein
MIADPATAARQAPKPGAGAKRDGDSWPRPSATSAARSVLGGGIPPTRTALQRPTRPSAPLYSRVTRAPGEHGAVETGWMKPPYPAPSFDAATKFVDASRAVRARQRARQRKSTETWFFRQLAARRVPCASPTTASSSRSGRQAQIGNTRGQAFPHSTRPNSRLFDPTSTSSGSL